MLDYNGLGGLKGQRYDLLKPAIDFDPQLVRFMINSSETKVIRFINGKI